MVKSSLRQSAGSNLFRYMTLFLAVLLWPGCDRTISEYQPRNRAEQEILSVLIEFQDAKNHRDIQRLLPLLHHEGEFTYACGVMVSKTELAAKLPEFWTRLDGDKLTEVPLAHECLNGDYYTSGVLKAPVITISGPRAQVKVWFTRRLWSSLLLFVSLARENGKWLITGTQWGPS